MVSGPTSIHSAPIMHFRPDPGEPAARLASPESQSAGLVTLQEQRNETRLRMRAMSQGEDIVYSNRTFSLGIGGSSPTVNGGLTTVVTKPDGNGYLPDSVFKLQAPQNQEPRETEPTTFQQEENQSSQSSAHNIQSAVQSTPEELEQKKQDIDSENRQLERNLLRAQLEKDRAYQNNNAVQAQQADRKQTNLVQKIVKNEEEIRAVEQEKIQQEKQDSQSNNIGQILSDRVAAATSVLGGMIGAGNTGALQQASTTPQIPRFSFAR